MLSHRRSLISYLLWKNKMNGDLRSKVSDIIVCFCFQCLLPLICLFFWPRWANNCLPLFWLRLKDFYTLFNCRLDLYKYLTISVLRSVSFWIAINRFTFLLKAFISTKAFPPWFFLLLRLTVDFTIILCSFTFICLTCVFYAWITCACTLWMNDLNQAPN